MTAPRLAVLPLLACAGCPSPTPTETPCGVSIGTRRAGVNQVGCVLCVVIHYTVTKLAQSLKILIEAGAEVSAHCLSKDASCRRTGARAIESAAVLQALVTPP